ncbi:hypothetical protein MKX01_038117 [Papaver californicum]|nr:hypothetical protein MKX01_038117 [Papaver californicum]
MAEEESEAAVRLTVLNGEELKDMRFLGKMKTFVVVWVNPCFKLHTKTLTISSRNPVWNYDLSIPLTLKLLKNPNSALTFQIISRSSPIFPEKVIGSAVLPLCQIQFTDEVFTLQVWRPSGRAKGLLKVSCRIEYNDGPKVGFCSYSSSGSAVEVNSNQRESTQGFSYNVHGYCTPSCSSNVIPSAPPMPDDYSSSGSSSSSTVILMPNDDSSSPMPDYDDPLIVKNDDPDIDKQEQLIPSDVVVDSSIKSNVMAGVLVGVLGGAVAVATLLIRAKANT